MAEFWDWLGRITGLKDIDSGSAALVSGFLALAAGVLAWFAVQRQIKASDRLERDRLDAQRKLEAERIEHERTVIERAFLAELLNLSSSVLMATALWNHRGVTYPNQRPDALPLFAEPRVYINLMDRLGLVREDWVAGAIVGFYGNLLQVNSTDGKSKTTCGDLAFQMRKISSNLAQALDGLNRDRPLRIPEEVRFNDLVLGDGKTTVDKVSPKPESLQALLQLMAMHPYLPEDAKGSDQAAQGSG